MRLFGAIGLLSVCAVGCSAGGDEGMVIVKNVVPGTMCTFTSQPTEAFFSSGEVNLHSTQGYIFAPQMASRIDSPMADQFDRTIITSAVNVDLTFADTTLAASLALPAADTHFSAPMSVMLPPIVAGSQVVTDGSFTLIPQSIIDAINTAMPGATAAGAAPFSTLVNADIQVIGSMAGESVDSQKFNYGVTIGNNVVVQNVGNCPAAQGSTVSTGNTCNEFQDGVLTCCTETGIGSGSGGPPPPPAGQLTCPARTN
jgi:hypothetical protein